MQTIDINITECKRIGQSKSHNPTFDLTTDTGRVYRTALDSTAGYILVEGKTGAARITVEEPRNRVIYVEYL